MAGFILGSYALGGAVAGFYYGSRTWRSHTEHRFVVTLAWTVGTAVIFYFQLNLVILSMVIFFAGFAISPTLIGGYSLIERQAPARHRTESIAWLSTSAALGNAVGSTVVGRIIDVYGAIGGYSLPRAMASSPSWSVSSVYVG
jgi:predicted MFS family arabinose efflux permease